MKAFWISWWNPPDASAFELHFPWWVSGTRGSDGAGSICAAVQAEDADAAVRMVRQCYDVPMTEMQFRFCEEETVDWIPYTDRFEKAEWMPAWPPGEETHATQRAITERSI